MIPRQQFPGTAQRQKLVLHHHGLQRKNPLQTLMGNPSLHPKLISTQSTHQTSVPALWPLANAVAVLESLGFSPGTGHSFLPLILGGVRKVSSRLFLSGNRPDSGTNPGADVQEVAPMDVVEGDEEEGALPLAQASSSSPDEAVAGPSNPLPRSS